MFDLHIFTNISSRKGKFFINYFLFLGYRLPRLEGPARMHLDRISEPKQRDNNDQRKDISSFEGKSAGDATGAGVQRGELESGIGGGRF